MANTTRFKKVLLVSPRFHLGRNKLSLHPPAGIAYVAMALSKAGIDVAVFDMNLGYEFDDLRRKIENFKPDCIGFTAMTLGYKYFYELVNTIKQLFPAVAITLGGAHISALRENVMEECEAIDFGIILEGDEAIVELCKGTDQEKIPGLVYRKNGKVYKNACAHFIDDLDKIGFPKYEAFELDKYPTKQIGIVTSRGCPYSCIYCSVIATSGKKFRVRSARSIAEEIEYWHNRDYRDIYMLDDNFTLIRSRVEELCAILKEKNFKGIHLRCPNGIRADKVDKTLLEQMREVGFDMIAFGVEAGDNKVLANLKKGESIEAMEKSIREACELGFDVDLFFLIGSPGETMNDVRKSFALAQRYPLRRAIFYNLIPLPSTELLDWLTQHNYLIYPIEKILNDASYYVNKPCFFTPEMSVEERKQALNEGNKLLLKIRRNYIARKLSGPVFLRKIFSIFYTLPLIDEAIINNSLVVKYKEKIKRRFLG